MLLASLYIFFILVHVCTNQKFGRFSRADSDDVIQCTKSLRRDPESPCSKKNLESPISSEELDLLKGNSLTVSTESCPSNASLTCLSVDHKSLVGAGSFGVVVRARSKTFDFPIAIKFIKLPTKLDIVSFNTEGRYNRIDRTSLIENRGSQKALREVAALRLITDYEIPSVPKYVAYIETSSYRIVAMELLQGYEELSKIIDKLSGKELIFISCQTAAIVCNLDRIGVSHDDMHERNVLVDRKNKNKVSVIDFGGAQFINQPKHFTSASNFLKQPINLLGQLKRSIKEDILDYIQSQEKQELGAFCSMMEKMITSKNEQEKQAIPYSYRALFEKYWKIGQTNKKLFKCQLTK